MKFNKNKTNGWSFWKFGKLYVLLYVRSTATWSIVINQPTQTSSKMEKICGFIVSFKLWIVFPLFTTFSLLSFAYLRYRWKEIGGDLCSSRTRLTPLTSTLED